MRSRGQRLVKALAVGMLLGTAGPRGVQPAWAADAPELGGAALDLRFAGPFTGVQVATGQAGNSGVGEVGAQSLGLRSGDGFTPERAWSLYLGTQGMLRLQFLKPSPGGTSTLNDMDTAEGFRSAGDARLGAAARDGRLSRLSAPSRTREHRVVCASCGRGRRQRCPTPLSPQHRLHRHRQEAVQQERVLHAEHADRGAALSTKHAIAPTPAIGARRSTARGSARD